jgi:hypothetical protein
MIDQEAVASRSYGFMFETFLTSRGKWHTASWIDIGSFTLKYVQNVS